MSKPTETERVLGLPELTPAPDARREWTQRLRTRQGRMTLLPAQAACLDVLARQEAPLGLVAALGVGEGKTLVSLLAPTALAWSSTQAYLRREGVARHAATKLTALLLVPSPLIVKTEREMRTYAKHWHVGTKIEVMGYGKLSQPSATRLLSRLRPHVLIVDEAHYLASLTSARTRRVVRYLQSYPETRVVLLSGTLTRRSLMDVGHLLEAALRHQSPLPVDRTPLEQWAAVIDQDGRPAARDHQAFAPVIQRHCTRADMMDLEPRDLARRALQRHYKSAPGLVISAGTTCDASLRLMQVKCEPSARIARALRALQRTWALPDGTPISLATDFGRHRKTLSIGLYLVWEWPDGIVDHEWVEARRGWGAAVRSFLEYQARPGLDSPALVERAARAGGLSTRMRQAYLQWQEVADRPEPPSVPRWIDRDWLPSVVEAWRRTQREPAVVWYQSRAVGDVLAEAGLPVHGAGSAEPVQGSTLAASIRVWGTGWNGQAWARSLVIEPPASGSTWEQLLGRAHRHGQTRDVVTYVLAHTPSYVQALERARAEARYVRDTTDTPQRLLLADEGEIVLDVEGRTSGKTKQRKTRGKA